MTVPTVKYAQAFGAFPGSTTIVCDVTAASIASGDGIIALFFAHNGFYDNVGDLTPPTGFTTISEKLTGNAPIVGLYKKIAAAADTSYTFTSNDGSDRGVLIVVIPSGEFDSGSFLTTTSEGVDFSLDFHGAGGASVAAGSVTTSNNDALVLGFYTGNFAGSWTAPAGGWAEDEDLNVGPYTNAVYSKEFDTASTGTTTATASGSVSANQGAAGLVVIYAFGLGPPPPAVSRVAVGDKSAGGTSTVSIASPAGTADGQMLLAGRCGWEGGVTFSDETDWTNTADLVGGTGTQGDNHATGIRVDRRELTGSLAGPTEFDQSTSGQGGCIGIMVSYELGEPTDTWDVVSTTGDDATHGANRAVTGSGSIALAPDDVVVVFVAVDTDASMTITVPAITASGITFGTTSRLTSGAGTNSGDDGNIEVFEATVTAGTGTVAPSLAFTTATNQCGPAAFVRLRAVAGGDISTSGHLAAGSLADNTTHSKDATPTGRLAPASSAGAAVTRTSEASGTLAASAATSASVSHDTQLAAALAAAGVPRAVVLHDWSTTGLLAAGGAAAAAVEHALDIASAVWVGVSLPATVTHALPVTPALWAASAEYGTVSHDATATGLLDAGADARADVAKDSSTSGHLPAGVALYALISGSADISTTGLTGAGAALGAAVSRDATVAALLAPGTASTAAVTHAVSVAAVLSAGAQVTAVVSHDANLIGLLAAGAAVYGLISSASDISTTGLAGIGAGIGAAVTHDADIAAPITVGVQAAAAVSRTADATGLLEVGPGLRSLVTRDASVSGVLAAGGTPVAVVAGGVSVVGVLLGGVLFLATGFVPPVLIGGRRTTSAVDERRNTRAVDRTRATMASDERRTTRRREPT